ncbi:MAG: glycosyltransferase family 4 protein [Candidatus Margulisiibacteriota bacterium]
MRRILILHPAFTVRGGAERKALVLAQYLLKHHHVEVACFEVDPARSFGEYLTGLHVRTFPAVGLGGRLMALLRMARYARQFDCVIAHNHPVQFAGWYRLISSRPAFIWFCNETQLYLTDTLSKAGVIKRIFIGLMAVVERWLCWRFSAVVANSQNTAGYIARHLHVGAKVIYSGIDFSAYPSQWVSRYPDSNGLKLIVVSRLERAKEVDRLLPVLDALTVTYRLTIVGTGADDKRLRAAFGGRPVEWVGSVSESEKIRLLCASDLFLFPTLNEPLGVTPIEAMACGLPVVAYRSGGVCETVVDGQTGRLVTDDMAFVDAIRELTADPQVYQKRSQAAFRHARERFSVDAMGAQVEDLVSLVLNGPGPV